MCIKHTLIATLALLLAAGPVRAADDVAVVAGAIPTQSSQFP